LPVSFTKFDHQFVLKLLQQHRVMKSQRVCLLLVIVLSTAALSRGQTWQDFRNNHINPDMKINDCDTVINGRSIKEHGIFCKPTNTFILANPGQVQAVCTGGGQPYQGNTISTVRFPIIVCRRTPSSGDRLPNCQYWAPADMYTNCIVYMWCQNRLPVHWVTDVR